MANYSFYQSHRTILLNYKIISLIFYSLGFLFVTQNNEGERMIVRYIGAKERFMIIFF